jgi:hypothetical protein
MIGQNLEWFRKLSLREQRKQIRRWRYFRRYFRKRYGDGWELSMLMEMHAL